MRTIENGRYGSYVARLAVIPSVRKRMANALRRKGTIRVRSDQE